MMNKIKRTVVIALSAVTVFSFSSATLAESPKINADNSISDFSFEGATWESDLEDRKAHTVDLTDPEAMEKALKESPKYYGQEQFVQSGLIQKAPPKSVDLSNDPAFPSIQSQKNVGSCAAFAAIYYQYTYYANKYNGISSASLENCYSPDWAFYANTNGSGISGTKAYKFTKEHGAVKWNELVPQSEFDPSHPMPSNEAMLAALSTRISSYKFIDVKTKTTSGASINVVGNDEFNVAKTLLNGGNVLRVTSQSGWNYGTTDSGEHCIVRFYKANSSVHSYCIVGYDDNVWVDVNGNGMRDSGEVGAFKMANSWGPGWMNNGFCWVLYDAMNAQTFIGGNWESKLSGERWPAFCDESDYVNNFSFITVANYKNYCVVQTNYSNVPMNKESVKTEANILGDVLTRTATQSVYYTGSKTFSSFLTYGPLISNVESLTAGASTFTVWRESDVPASSFSAKLVDNKGNLISNMTRNNESYSTLSLHFIKGDVNYDFKLNARDVSAVQKYVLDTDLASDLQFYLADYNGDGTINARDVSAIMNAM